MIHVAHWFWSIVGYRKSLLTLRGRNRNFFLGRDAGSPCITQ